MVIDYLAFFLKGLSTVNYLLRGMIIFFEWMYSNIVLNFLVNSSFYSVVSKNLFRYVRYEICAYQDNIVADKPTVIIVLNITVTVPKL